jgi:hypothetical protein
MIYLSESIYLSISSEMVLSFVFNILYFILLIGKMKNYPAYTYRIVIPLKHIYERLKDGY